jgi:hypothetical protein
MMTLIMMTSVILHSIFLTVLYLVTFKTIHAKAEQRNISTEYAWKLVRMLFPGNKTPTDQRK